MVVFLPPCIYVSGVIFLRRGKNIPSAIYFSEARLGVKMHLCLGGAGLVTLLQESSNIRSLQATG